MGKYETKNSSSAVRSFGAASAEMFQPEVNASSYQIRRRYFRLQKFMRLCIEMRYLVIFISMTVTHDISKFKPLREDEDSRFSDLAQLVRRSYNTLKEVNRQFDMDNNHMIAIIEQKLHVNDRKIWSRYLETSQKKATLENLITWMTII